MITCFLIITGILELFVLHYTIWKVNMTHKNLNFKNPLYLWTVQEMLKIWNKFWNF